MLKKLQCLPLCTHKSFHICLKSINTFQGESFMGKMLLSVLRPFLVIAVLHALLFGRAIPSRANPAPAKDNT
jgi:hypothetical protein